MTAIIVCLGSWGFTHNQDSTLTFKEVKNNGKLKIMLNTTGCYNKGLKVEGEEPSTVGERGGSALPVLLWVRGEVSQRM